MKKIIAVDGKHLRDLVEEHIEEYSSNCDLNHINVSSVRDMSDIFSHLNFNGNISQWDVSNVENMNCMEILVNGIYLM